MSEKAPFDQIFHQLLQDDRYYNDVLEWFTSRTTITSQPLRKLLSKFKTGISNSFPFELQNWILVQLTPFLNPSSRPIDSTPIIQQGPTTDSQTNDASSPLVSEAGNRQLTIANLPITVKVKQKKRLKPTVQVDEPNLSTTKGFGSKLPTVAEESDPVTELPSKLDQSPQIENSESAQVEPVLENARTPTKKNTIGSIDNLTILYRLSTLYAQLILQQHLPLQPAVVFLSKLSSTQFHDIGPGLKPALSNGLFSDLVCVLEFTVRCLEILSPLLLYIGRPLLNGFALWPPLGILAPSTQLAFLSAAEDDSFQNRAIGSSLDLFAMHLPETFIRPFREETDSRLEYTTQLESAVYNEREKLFDSFFELFNQFQSVTRSDIDGSKLSLFWQVEMSAFTLKLSATRDCNFPWFADIFKSMLMFYGLNSSYRVAGPNSSKLDPSSVPHRQTGNSTVSGSSPDGGISSQDLSSSENRPGTVLSPIFATERATSPLKAVTSQVVPPLSVFHAYASVSASVPPSAKKHLPSHSPWATPTQSPNTLSSGVSSSGANAMLSGSPNNFAGPSANSASNRQRKLEERMGPGGTGGRAGGILGAPNRAMFQPSSASTNHQNGRSSRLPLAGSSDSSSVGTTLGTPATAKSRHDLSQHSKFSNDLYEEPSASFPGNQQFFFRFLLIFDSSRFTQSLHELLTSEIAKISSNSPQSSSQNVGAVGGNPLGPSSPVVGMMRMDSSGLEASYPSPVKLPRESSEQSHLQQPLQRQSASEPLVLRILKLRLLGKFLGLLEFWPQWTLSVPIDNCYISTRKKKTQSLTAVGTEGCVDTATKKPNALSNIPGNMSSASLSSSSSGGPLTLQVYDRARYRALFRKILPVKQEVESAYLDGRLTIVIPWVVEFMSMIEWDRSIFVDNPYKDTLGMLLAIQRSELFNPIRGKLSGNRLSVLCEIQRLWESIPIETIKIFPLPSGNPSNGSFRNRSSSNVSNNSFTTTGNLGPVQSMAPYANRMDDQHDTLSSSFMSYLFPPLHEAATSLSKSKSIVFTNEQLAICRSSDFSTRSLRLPEAVSTSSFGGRRNTSMSSLQSDVSSQPIYVTPSRDRDRADDMTTPTRMSSVSSDWVQVSNTPGLATPTPNRIGISVRTPSQDDTSPLAFLPVAVTPRRQASVPKSRQSTSTPIRSLTPSSGQKEMIPATFDPSASSGRGDSPLTAFKGSTRLTNDGKENEKVESLTGFVSQTLSSASEIAQSASEEAYKTEVAFWQQHSQLYQIHCFLVDQVHQSCLAQLREHIAEAVRKMFIDITQLKSEIFDTAQFDPAILNSARQFEIDVTSLEDTKSCVAGSESESDFQSTSSMGHVSHSLSRIPQDVVWKKIQDQLFRMKLQHLVNETHSNLCDKGSEFVRDFMATNLSHTQKELFSLYPTHERVNQLAAFLTKRQVDARRKPLLEFLTSYSARKFEEVQSLTIKQLQKSISQSGTGALRSSTEELDIADGGSDRVYLTGTNRINAQCPSRADLLFSDCLSEDFIISFCSTVAGLGDFSALSSSANDTSNSTGFDTVKIRSIDAMKQFSTTFGKIRGLQCIKFGTGEQDVARFPAELAHLRVPGISFAVVISEHAEKELSRSGSIGQNTNINIVRNRLLASAESVINLLRRWVQLRLCNRQVSSLGNKSEYQTRISDNLAAALGAGPEDLMILSRNVFGVFKCIVDAQYELFRTTSDDFEQQGKIRIDIVKLFVSALPALLYLDLFHLEDSIVAKSKLISSSLPTALVIEAIKRKVIDMNEVARVVTSTCRQSTASYYQACFGFANMKLVAEVCGLRLLGQLLKLESSPSSIGTDICEISSEHVMSDEELRRILKMSQVSQEFKSILSSLLSRVYSKS